MARDGVPAEPAARRQKDARRGANTNRFSGAADFAAYVIDAFDWLHREGAHVPKMMSIGLHLRMIGRPGRIRMCPLRSRAHQLHRLGLLIAMAGDFF